MNLIKILLIRFICTTVNNKTDPNYYLLWKLYPGIGLMDETLCVDKYSISSSKTPAKKVPQSFRLSLYVDG